MMYNCLHVGVDTGNMNLLKKELGEYILTHGGIRVIIRPEDDGNPDVPSAVQDALQETIISMISAIVCGEWEALQ